MHAAAQGHAENHSQGADESLVEQQRLLSEGLCRHALMHASMLAVYTCMHARTHACVHALTRLWRSCARVYACTQAFMRVHALAHVHTCTQTRTYACTD